MDSKVAVWIREFLLGRMQRVRVGGQLSEEVRVKSGVPLGSVLGPLLFLAYLNDICKYMKLTIRRFTVECVIFRKIINNEDMDNLQKILDWLCEWAVGNAMKLNPIKSKEIHFTRAGVMYPLHYSLMDTLIPEASSFKYLGMILCSDISWVDQVNYTLKKALKALHFMMRIQKKLVLIQKLSLEFNCTTDS